MPRPTKPASASSGEPKNNSQSVLDQFEMWGQKLGLERIQATLAALGRPEKKFPVVLVAGTNGKGSTAAFLASILHSAGYRGGLFTSPHLQSVRERIRVEGLSIADHKLHQTLQAVVAASTCEGQPLPSYFEAVTAAALLYFAQCKVDVAVLEVGLGGRLDATNATEPQLSIITSIAHDHQEHLGNRLDQIAREKAGIARAGKPLLAWAPGQAGVQGVLRDLNAQGVEVEELWRGLRIQSSTPSDAVETKPLAASKTGRPAQTFSVLSWNSPSAKGTAAQDQRSYRLESQLAGKHQRVNAAIALRAAERLALLGFPRVDHRAIENGIKNCRWPGRLEEVQLNVSRAPAANSENPSGRTGEADRPSHNKETTNKRVLLDGAHNLAGAKALASHLALILDSAPETKFDLLFASLRGKKAAKALALLAPWVGRIWITAPTSHRALPADGLVRALDRQAPETAQRCRVITPFERALDTALQTSKHGLVICGSLYAVGEARTWLHRHFCRPKPAADRSLFAADLEPAQLEPLST